MPGELRELIGKKSLTNEQKKAFIEFGKKLQVECTHDEVEQKYNSCVCAICGETLGWWCPDSPTHTCEYRPERGDREYTLLVGIPPWKWGDEEECIYCHKPTKRF